MRGEPERRPAHWLAYWDELGTTATPGGTVAAAKLACTIRQEPVTADTVSATLSCKVTGSASDQTSFEATYTTATPGAQGGTEVSCDGALHNGSGNCDVTFDQSARASRLGTVTAELLPSQRRIGPVTPTPTL